jgi:nitrile hydratase
MSEHQDHTPPPDADGPLTYHQRLARALEALLMEKGVFSANEMRTTIEEIDARSPADGAKLVARAWLDEDFKARLLSDANAAAAEFGIDGGDVPVVVMENTARIHNLIVCTLCSCYPRRLIGLPPDWYKSQNYRRRAVREPRVVIAEFGTIIPDDVEVRVHDSTAELRYMVLPMRPAGTDGMDEEALAALVTRDCLVGVTNPTIPSI